MFLFFKLQSVYYIIGVQHICTLMQILIPKLRVLADIDPVQVLAHQKVL